MNSPNYDALFENTSDILSCAEKPTCAFTHHLEILRKAPVFSGTFPDILKLCAYMSRSVEYKKGDLILKQGDRATSAYFVMEGTVEAYQDIPGEKGETFIFQRMSDLDFFGELALLADFECFVNVRACSDVKLLALDRTSFQKIVSKFEDKRNELVEKIIQLRVKRFENQMTLFIEQLVNHKKIGKTK